MTELKESSTVRVTYRYLGVGALVGTTYNEPMLLTRVYDGFSNAYDALDRFNRLIISRWEKTAQSDRYNVALTYDRNSNITTLDDSVQTPGSDWKYTYDALDRLTEAQAGTLSGGSITSETRQQVWDLDHAGNWKHTELSGTGVPPVELFDWDFDHNKVNEITQWDNQTNQVVPAYDAAGNMTDDKRDWKYEYDAWYRLVKVKDQSNNLKAQFRYNGLGFRISARYDDTDPWQHFAYDERWRIVAMFEGTDTDPTEQFWYQNAGASGMGGSSYIDEVVLRDRDTDGNGTLDERRYYLQNWHHDVMVLCDTSGSVSERLNYDAYGSPIGTFTAVANRKGYAGYEYDRKLSDIYHVRHRVYRSDLGTWASRDPISFVAGINLYLYVSASPPKGTDGSGLIDQLVGRFTAETPGDCGRYWNTFEYVLLKPLRGCDKPFVVHEVTISKRCSEDCCAAEMDVPLEHFRFLELPPRFEFADAGTVAAWQDHDTINSRTKRGNVLHEREAYVFCIGDFDKREFDDLQGWDRGRIDSVFPSCSPAIAFTGTLRHKLPPYPDWWTKKRRSNKVRVHMHTWWKCCDPSNSTSDRDRYITPEYAP